MTQTITITLPADVTIVLEDFARKEGIAPDELVGRAVKQHLFLRQFRTMRERMSAKAESQGIFTDQDVFDRVS